MGEDKRISDLFERARTEAPKTSFDEMKKHVVAASAVGGVGILAKWIALSFKLKVVVMTSILTTLTVSSLIVVSSISSNPVETNKTDQKKKFIPMKNLEVSREAGVQKTIIYDENDKVIEIIVDSSKKASPTTETTSHFELSTVKAKPITPKTPQLETELIELGTSTHIRRFTIMEETTTEELDRIRDLAEKAGIVMDYTARVKRNVIKKLNINFILDCDGDTSTWNVSISGSDDFSVEVGWEENAEGEATNFLDDNTIQSGESKIDVSTKEDGTNVEIRN